MRTRSARDARERRGDAALRDWAPSGDYRLTIDRGDRLFALVFNVDNGHSTFHSIAGDAMHHLPALAVQGDVDLRLPIFIDSKCVYLR